MTTFLSETTERQAEATDRPRHFLGWEEGKALCGVPTPPLYPAKSRNVSQIACVVCADLWNALPPHRRSALRMFWGLDV